jgi:S-ribosylhomocysteine lyase LuxS involved in autoinducer biosynthesis
LLGLRGWLSLLEEVCLQWVLQPEVTREQVVLLLEHSLHAILTTTVSTVPALTAQQDGDSGQADLQPAPARMTEQTQEQVPTG